MAEAQDLRLSYLRAVTEQHHRQSRIGTVIALFLLPTGFVLDWMVYPDIQMELAKYRIACEILLFVIFLAHLIPGSIRYTKVLSFSWAIVIEVSICMMIITTQEAFGPYYAGLSLVVLGFILMLPLTFFEACLLALITISVYSVTAYFDFNHIQSTAGYINNFYFLVSTCFIGCCASYYSAQRRFREFKLNYDLDIRTKELAELNRVKSDFYANISHEFRTPLTLILAPIEDLLARHKFDPIVKGGLNHIKENGYRLLKLVNDLLDVQKLEEKKTFLECQPVSLNGLLKNICSGMESLAKRRVIKLQFHQCARTLMVDGDESALEKIFINLINNAIKFTEAGGAVDIYLKVQAERCVIEVIDTGSGISSDALPHIFERFHQADTSTTRKHQGTGLGLALVKELTQLHSGDITVESTLGTGTQMSISLPLLTDEAARVDARPQQHKAKPDGLQELHRSADLNMGALSVVPEAIDAADTAEAEPDNSESILASGSLRSGQLSSGQLSSESLPKLLIVEDEPGIREYLAQTLGQDYQISVAEDGAEGLFLIRKERPDLIILDLMLPKIDGLSVCETVKSDPELRRSKIILLTANTDENSKLEALRRGADDFLTKPFSTVEIKSRLANMWNTSQLQIDVEKQNLELTDAIEELKTTQGHLIQSEKLNALGRLAAGLLHEVNNPLNFAFATFQLLEREPCLSEEEYAQELMKDIRTGMERISTIVKDLKTFAYPETTDLQSSFKLRDAIESAMRFTASRTLNVKIDNSAEDETLIGSQSHIVQVMVNLLENASDAMQSISDRESTISINSQQLENGRIQVIFTDNGPGIPEDIKDKIFDPFYTTKDVGAGMGMGLSICHTIIDNHKGTLAVESEKDSHTTFTFDLGDALVAMAGQQELAKEI